MTKETEPTTLNIPVVDEREADRLFALIRAQIAKEEKEEE